MAFRALNHFHFYGGEVEVKREPGRSYVILDSLSIANLDVHRKVEDNAVRGFRLMLEHGPESEIYKALKRQIRTPSRVKPISQLDMQDVCSYFHLAPDHPTGETPVTLKALYESYFGIIGTPFKDLLDTINFARNARDHGHHINEEKHLTTSQRRAKNVFKLMDTVDAILGPCVRKGIKECQPFLDNNKGLRVTFIELLNVSRCQRSFQDMRKSRALGKCKAVPLQALGTGRRSGGFSRHVRFGFETQKQVTKNLLSDLLDVVENGTADEQMEVVSFTQLMITRQKPNARPGGLECWGCGLDVGAPRGYYTEFRCDHDISDLLLEDDLATYLDFVFDDGHPCFDAPQYIKVIKQGAEAVVAATAAAGEEASDKSYFRLYREELEPVPMLVNNRCVWHEAASNAVLYYSQRSGQWVIGTREEMLKEAAIDAPAAGSSTSPTPAIPPAMHPSHCEEAVASAASSTLGLPSAWTVHHCSADEYQLAMIPPPPPAPPAPATSPLPTFAEVVNLAIEEVKASRSGELQADQKGLTLSYKNRFGRKLTRDECQLFGYFTLGKFVRACVKASRGQLRVSARKSPQLYLQLVGTGTGTAAGG